MRLPLISGLAIGLFATAAHAEMMGTVPLGPDGVSGVLTESMTCSDVMTWRMDLEAGKDYAFGAMFDPWVGGGTATLRSPGGAAVMSFSFSGDGAGEPTFGHEYRAAQTGAYFLDIPCSTFSSGAYYQVLFQYDCPGGQRTQCTLPVGTTRKSYITFRLEWDWWKVTLKAGQHYDVTINEPVTGLVLRDAKGKPIVRSDYDEEHHTIAAICGFRPRVSGTYYVDVEGEVDNGAEYDFEGSYAVSLRAR